jgi:predicted nucleic acid-binding protein
MAGYLLDTNILSELMKKDPSPRVLHSVGERERGELFTSSVCFMELRSGAARHREGTSLWTRIREEIEPLVSVLPLAYEEAVRAGEILADLEGRGAPIGLEDVLIGSTALVRGISVATRNVKHFERIKGLSVENWFV